VSRMPLMRDVSEPQLRHRRRYAGDLLCVN
jgi:hypothetical protein